MLFRSKQNTPTDLITGVLVVSVYLLMRNYGKHRAKERIMIQLSKEHNHVRVTVMPSLKVFYKWDFVAITDTHDIVGQYNPIFNFLQSNKGVKIIQTLIQSEDDFDDLFKSTKVGALFSEFSPLLHYDVTKGQEDDLITIRAIDMRYFFKQRFMHHATLVIDAQHNVISGHIHPYTLNKAIAI